MADAKSPWSDRYAAEVARIARRDLEPKLGKKLLTATTRVDWTDLVATKRRAAPAMASAMFRVVASFLSYAEANGWIAAPLLPRKGAATLAPATAAPRADTIRRRARRSLARRRQGGAEAAGLHPSADPDCVPRDGGRRHRCGRARPGNRPLVDPRTADEEWASHHAAARSARRRRASRRAARPRRKCRIPVAGPDPRSGLRGFSKLKARLDDRIAEARMANGVTEKMPGWRWHDLRRTARTGMTRLGVPREHAEAAVNHISARSALERTYDRYDYGPEIIAALSAMASARRQAGGSRQGAGGA